MDVLTHLASFALVAGLLTIIPGPDTAIVLRAALARGPRHGFATAFGIGSGTLVWGAAAAAGVSAVLTTSRLAYTSLRILGACYLLWLAYGLLRAAWVNRYTDVEAAPVAGTKAAPGLWSAWGRGVLTSLTNPKVGVFYMAMIPQFVPSGAPHLAFGILLALVHDIEGMLWFTAIILGANSLRTKLRRPRFRRALDASTGTVMAGFGITLAATDG
ncbi:LysE family translocator [Embleya scabrispora]|uniref:LysE family translocator n=1 Tax=Embleya scabrispora TaxID=159449 RepID=UPI0003771B54|nr:LysE family translocator [Embleya scabrispora]MYS85726.1 LysE family transporter [Streptomyces sp. SID5474]